MNRFTKNKRVTVPWELDEALAALISCDAYKLTHRLMYPDGITNLYLTFTTRGGESAGFADLAWDHTFVKKVVGYVFGNFTRRVIALSRESEGGKTTRMLKKRLRLIFGSAAFADDFTACLKALGRDVAATGKLPLVVKALRSSEHVRFRECLMTITGKRGIKPEHVWLVSYFETILLENIWQFHTSLTIARDLRELVDDYAKKSGVNPGFTRFQCHDFSMRGMSSL